MLQPRESDILSLIIFLVVIPLFTYILLGRWSEASKKNARISLLAQLAAEEASQVEEMACASVLPVLLPPSRTGLHECARCFAPATTRCSRCKLVRYCSGKCQIMHWRQGHKYECLQWDDSSFNACAGLSPKPFVNSTKSPYFPGGIPEPLHYNPHSDIDDPVFMTADTSLGSEIGRKPLDKSTFSKLKMIKLNGDDITTCAFEQDCGHHEAFAQAPSTNHFTEIVSEDAPAGHKLAGESLIQLPSQILTNQEINCPSSSRNGLTQHSKSTGEGRKGLKQNGSPVMPSQPHSDKTEYQNGTNISSEKVVACEPGFSSFDETVHAIASYPAAERPSAKESIMYRKPPYTLGHIASSSQKLAENGSREHPCQGVERNGIQEKSASLNTQKTPRVLKRNLVGLINDNRKNKLCEMLFPYEDLVKFFQCEEWRVFPRGLHNCGNSCYANAVLQCLTGTKPLMVYLLRRLHSQTCCVKEWCLMCELEQHVSFLREGGGPLSPSRILSNMRNIGCRMGGGNQEDAHEFLRLLVMSMQSVCLEELGGEKEVEPRLQETTVIQQIFGGRLRSKVKCLRCHHESERYESIMDLTLEIHGCWVESLEDALTQFTAPEDLDRENMYRCGRCLAYVKAQKQLSLHEVPNILTIVLKRFQTGKYGKINKCVTFPDMLDMIPFVTGTADKPPLYLLYAVVVHLDNLNASFAGHYISYVKDLEGTWFRIDDSEVQVVPLSQVMLEGAYMLFYLRSFPRPPPQTYAERRLLSRLPVCSTRRNATKSQKPWKHVVCNGAGDMSGEHVARWAGVVGQRAEFSDATSSDWSLFTSSDDSSFTTESTRDSFSTVDHGDGTAALDAVSSLFSGPFYAPDYGGGDAISGAKRSPARPQTRFFADGGVR